MDNSVKLRNLSYYLQKGWPIFPCKVNGKEPLTQHGFHDASLDPGLVHAWHEKNPDANWATRTGDANEGGAGLVVIDIDKKSGGLTTWDLLREESPRPR
jgi:hypothetical protein